MTEIGRLKSGIKKETQLFSIPDKTVKEHMLLIPSLDSGEMIKGNMQPRKQQQTRNLWGSDGSSKLSLVESGQGG